MSAMYIMKWPSGEWVQRDDSTGPMSTGGYPMKVKEIHRATIWTDKMEALRYRHTCRTDNLSLYILNMKTALEEITPAEEAEASGDKEFLEFQRLAKKYGMMGAGECPFSVAWVGKCKNIPEIGEIYCSKHKNVKCFKCDAQAVRDCEHTSQFVCGVPMCKEHNHH